MSRVRTVLLLSVLAVAAGTAVLLWRPWDPVPDGLRDALTRVEELPGVIDADAHYEVTTHDLKDGNGARAGVTVRLDDDLSPQDAAETAGRVAAAIDSVEIPGVRSLHTSLWFNAGRPRSTNGVDVYPVMVPWEGTDDDGASASPETRTVEDAFTLWHAGAVAVRAADATARDGDHLIELARFAAERGIATGLRTADERISYEAMGTVPDVTAARLIAEVGSLPAVASAGYDAYAEPALRVRLDVALDSPQADEILAHVEAADYAETIGKPVRVVLLDAGFAQRSGWVSALAPPEPEPHPLPLPAGVDAWPEDDAAPACTGADLEPFYGGSDAATGARYASVRARNTSGRPCAVEGIPDVVFRNADGEPQRDITADPYGPGVVAERVVVPPGEEVFAPIEWRAMSTANDPDVTTTIEVTAVRGAGPVLLDILGHVSAPDGLDLLDGAHVRVGPWVQALEGWS